jgi:hypothetical protein
MRNVLTLALSYDSAPSAGAPVAGFGFRFGGACGGAIGFGAQGNVFGYVSSAPSLNSYLSRKLHVCDAIDVIFRVSVVDGDIRPIPFFNLR